MRMALHADKREAQKQWDTDPCGAVTAAGEQIGTLAFYRAVRTYRYEVHAPWMDSAMRFASAAGSSVLEIGVGLGSDHYRFAAAGCQMTALDLSSEHLRHTQRHMALEGLTTKAVLGDAEQMPFADACFDLVYSMGVLHHTPRTDKALAEVLRVLRPGGTALIGLYHRNSAFFWLETLLINGVLRGRLLTRGWRRLLSDIEYRSDPAAAAPLVKVYSRGQTARLLAAFANLQVETHHIQAPTARLERWLPREMLERRCSRLGWYLVARARKG